MSSGVSSSSFSFTSTTRRFEGITSSFTMIESSFASIKTKRVDGIIWYLHSKDIDVFI